MLKKIIILFVVLITWVEFNVKTQENFSVDESMYKSSYDVKVKDLLPVKVLKVMDAQTIFVEYELERGKVSREIVKLIGIDAVEEDEKGTRNTRRIKERIESAADRLTKSALEEKKVYLAFDRIRSDRDGNMLVYVYFGDGNCYNAMMVRQGYAKVSIWYPFTFEKEFLKFEEEAKGRMYGIWR